MKNQKSVPSEEIAVLLVRTDDLLDNNQYEEASKIANDILVTLNSENGSLSRTADKAHALCILGSYLYGTAHYDEAFEYYTSALALAQDELHLTIQARALNGISAVLIVRGDNEMFLQTCGQALAVAEKSASKSELTDSLLRYGKVHTFLANYSTALEYLVCALGVAREQDHKKNIQIALHLIGNVYCARSDYPLALEYYEQALSTAEESGQKHGITRTLGAKANVYYHLGDFSKALEICIRGLAVAEEIGDKTSVAYQSGVIGLIYSDLPDHKRAIEYISYSIAIFEELGMMRYVAMNIGNLGVCYLDVGDFIRAEENLGRAMKLSLQLGDQLSVAHYTMYLAKVQWKLGQIEAAREGFVDTLVLLRNVIKSNSGVSETLLYLGSILIESGQIEEGLARLEETLALARESGEKPIASKAHKNIADAYAKLGEGIKAYEHLSMHVELDKEIFSEESKKNVEKFNMRVAIAKEEQEKEIEKLKREQVERELSNTTLQLVSQTELLVELRDDLLKFVRKFPMPDDVARELRNRLKTLPCKSIDWEKFDTQFKAAHPEFTKKLLETYPKLSAMESRICSLIRMNLKSEEIARLFCLSDRTVENHRQHIREKMELKNKVDLTLHLTKI